MSSSSPVRLLGIDTGGTFTDYVGRTEEGGTVRGKVSSTPGNPDRAIERVLGRLDLSEDCRFVHGTTVATNALLEDELADVVLVTNEGFDGLLDVGRGTRPDLYDLNPDPSSVTPFDVPVLTVPLRDHPMVESTPDLSVDEAESLRRDLRDLDPEVVAVCLLHSYRDGKGERQVREALAPLDVPVVRSSEVLPRFREYERAGTTTVNAGLKPIVSEYLEALEDLQDLPRDRYLMGSDRGALTFREAAERPVLTVLSGPAGGVVGSRENLEDRGVDQFVSMDMGGTSTDVTAVEDRIPLTDDHEIGNYPIGFPMVDVHTVGSGGGSILRVDEAGGLRVGPQSAGAEPGPACYGEGGPPTLTDAQLVLGRIPQDRPLSEDLSLDAGSARDALESLAEALGRTVEEAALGGVRLARTKLVEAVRSITVREGKDPSEFALIAHGGAGGLFAAGVAESLDVDPVYVPRQAGVASAAGLLRAPQFAQRSISPMVELEGQGDLPGLESLLERSPDWVTKDTERRFEAECRYVGQSHTIEVVFEDASTGGRDLADRFEEKYEETYGYRPDESGVELVHLNAHWTETFEGQPRERFDGSVEEELGSQRLVTEEGAREVPVRDLQGLEERLEGPGLLSGSTTTVFVPPRWSVEPVTEGMVRLNR